MVSILMYCNRANLDAYAAIEFQAPVALATTLLSKYLRVASRYHSVAKKSIATFLNSRNCDRATLGSQYM